MDEQRPDWVQRAGCESVSVLWKLANREDRRNDSSRATSSKEGSCRFAILDISAPVPLLSPDISVPVPLLSPSPSFFSPFFLFNPFCSTRSEHAAFKGHWPGVVVFRLDDRDKFRSDRRKCQKLEPAWPHSYGVGCGANRDWPVTKGPVTTDEQTEMKSRLPDLSTPTPMACSTPAIRTGPFAFAHSDLLLLSGNKCLRSSLGSFTLPSME
jgi:hypothetical protein